MGRLPTFFPDGPRGRMRRTFVPVRSGFLRFGRRAPRRRPPPGAFTLGLLLLSVVGCGSSSKWRAPYELRAPDRLVAAALGDSWQRPAAAFDPASVAVPPEPTNLRPCCAFGVDLQVAVGAVPIPGVSLGNIRGPEEVGPHKYNIGLFETATSAERRSIERENNGVVYTCRGGFLDTAHIRDLADLTVYLTARIEQSLGAGAVIPLASQGARLRVVVEPLEEDLVADLGRRRLAIAAAQWLAFQVSVWHEIATWYGYASIPGWPEKISAFSPEDLYSNIVGIELAGGILHLHDASDERQYNESLNAWLAMALRRLDVRGREQARAAMRAVDGLWWDSSRRVPDWQLVRRRNFDIGATIRPWTIDLAFADGDAPDVGCSDTGPPLRLRVPATFAGFRFDPYVRLEIEVDAALLANGFPKRVASRGVTQADFPAIIAAIRAEHEEALGPGADRP